MSEGGERERERESEKERCFSCPHPSIDPTSSTQTVGKYIRPHVHHTLACIVALFLANTDTHTNTHPEVIIVIHRA